MTNKYNYKKKLKKKCEEVLEVCDAANNVSLLTRDFNDVRKFFY